MEGSFIERGLIREGGLLERGAYSQNRNDKNIPGNVSDVSPHTRASYNKLRIWARTESFLELSDFEY